MKTHHAYPFSDNSLGLCAFPGQPFPFRDHANWAEVMRREELNAMWLRQEPLSQEALAERARLNQRARPPIYDRPPHSPVVA